MKQRMKQRMKPPATQRRTQPNAQRGQLPHKFRNRLRKPPPNLPEKSYVKLRKL
jgi:hypothetical protein